MAAEREFYTVKELAQILGKSTDRVYEALRGKYIKGSKMRPHGAWLIPKSEVARLKGEPSESEGLKQFGEQRSQGQQSISISITEARHLHLSQIRNLLQLWHKTLPESLSYILEGFRVMTDYTEAEYEELFPYMLQHCPSINDKYQSFKAKREEYKDIIERIREEVKEALEEAVVEGKLGGHLLREPREIIPGLIVLLLRYSKESLQERLDHPTTHLALIPFKHFFIKGGEETLNSCRQFARELKFKHCKKDSINYGLQELSEKGLPLIDALALLHAAINKSLIDNEHLKHKCALCP